MDQTSQSTGGTTSVVKKYTIGSTSGQASTPRATYRATSLLTGKTVDQTIQQPGSVIKQNRPIQITRK